LVFGITQASSFDNLTNKTIMKITQTILIWGMLYFASCLITYGQTEKTSLTDLLKQVENQSRSDLEKATQTLLQAETLIQDDLDKAKVWYAKAKIALENGKYEESTTLFKEGIVLAQKEKAWSLVGDLLRYQHYTYHDRKQYEEARTCLYQSLGYYRKATDKRGETLSLSSLIKYYPAQDKMDSVYQVLAHNQAFYARQPLPYAENVLYSNMGTLHSDQARQDSALFYHLKSLKISEKSGDIKAQITVLMNIGLIYLFQNKNEKGIEIFSNALELVEKHKVTRFHTGLLNNRAVTYRRLKNYQLAIQDYQKALSIAINNNDLGEQAMTWYNIGNARQDQGEEAYPEAIEAYQKSNKICHDLGIEIGYMYNANGLAKLFLTQKQYAKAKPQAELALEVAQKMNQTEAIKIAYHDLAQIYAGLKQYQKAYHFQVQTQTLSDSLFNAESDARITEMQTKYETEKKEKENQILKVQNDQIQTKLNLQKTQLYASTTGAILILIIAGLLQRSRQLQRKTNLKLEQRNQEIKTQAQVLEETNHKLRELDQFKQTLTGMIAHDLKNPLNTIIGYSENGVESASQVIYQSGKRILNLVQNMLDVQKFEDAQIQPTLENISAYELANKATQQVSLLAQEKNLVIRNDISSSIFIQADAELTERIFVNLLTNAIKYSTQNQLIILNAKAISDMIQIWVKDNGTGIPSEFLPQVFEKFTQVEAKKSGMARSTGLGLTFCKMATEIQGGNISVESELDKGSKFIFSLPQGKTNIVTFVDKNEQHNLFNKEEKQLLVPYFKEMQKYSIYESLDLYRIVVQIPEQTEGIKTFKEQLGTVIFSGNQEEFGALLQEFS